ncbi:MAG: putative cyclase [Monoraphidium minutum]|nr:MAG: putative cyclase [Monoraphidium minutum]
MPHTQHPPRSWRALSFSQDEGDVVNQSHLNLDAHTGTHIDAPRHFLPGAATLEQLPLSVLTGHADVIAVPHDTNVTAAALAGLAIPQDAERLLFKTLNTERWLMRQTPFASDYVGLDSSAAAWLAAERPGVALVGIDYLSIGMLEDIVEAHKGLFRKGTVVVEGLDLSAAPPGRHHLTCLPLLLEGSDGAPARCILQLAGDTAA